MPAPVRTSAVYFALAGLALSVVGVVPATASPTPEVAAMVSEPSAPEIDGSFEVRHYDVVPVPSSPEPVDPGVAMSTVAPSVVVELEGSPEMIILDRVEGAETLSVRSRNAGQWSAWVEVATDVDDAPDGLPGGEGADTPALGSAGPVWLGDQTEAVEIAAVDAVLGSLRIEALTSLDSDIDPRSEVEGEVVGEAEAGVPDGVVGNAVVGNAVVGNAVAARPSIQPRSAWTSEGWATQNSGCTNGPTYSDTLRAAIVHHTVNTNDYAASQSDDLLRGIYRYHTNTQGWCDIAYNFLIDRFGTIWEARMGGTDRPVIGGHTRGFNTWTVGVALLGQYQQGGSPAAVDPPPAMVESLRRLVGWKLGLYGVDPLGTTWLKNRSSGAGMKFAAGQWVEVPTVLGHRDLGVSSCPGSRAYPLVGAMRGQLGPTGQQVGAAPYVFPAWEGDDQGVAAMVVDSSGGIRPAMAAGSAVPAPAVGGGAIAIAGTGTSGWVLGNSGELRPYGGAPAVAGRPAGPATVVDLAVSGSGGGWILTADGALVAFGGAPDRVPATRPAAGSAVAVDLDGAGNGYVVDRSGGLHPVGSAPSPSPTPRTAAAVDVAVRPDGRSGWVLDNSSTLVPFGGAPAVTLTGSNRSATRAIVGSDTGYGGWVLDAEGRLLAFGQVPFAGSVSTHVGQTVAVDVARVGYRIDPAQAAGKKGKLAAALYRTFIGTAPTPVMLDHWVWRLDEMGGADVAAEFASSDEWAGAVVNDIYGTALGRAPDDEGRRYWVDQLRNGMRVQDLGTYFYGSNEYFASAGSPGAYVDLLYRELLGRSADAGGRGYWVSQLDRGVTPAGVAGGFYASLESRRDRVGRLFGSILGRDPDPGGHQYWADWLVDHDDIDLAANLASSEEYYLRATS